MSRSDGVFSEFYKLITIQTYALNAFFEVKKKECVHRTPRVVISYMFYKITNSWARSAAVAAIGHGINRPGQ